MFLKCSFFNIKIQESYHQKVLKNDNSFGKRLSSKPLNFLSNEFSTIEKEKKKNDSSLNKNSSSSTLSLHISAYENAIQNQIKQNFMNESLKGKQIPKSAVQKFLNKTFLSPKIQNSFEFPRQQKPEDDDSEPEILNFIASQKLLTPNSTSTSNNQPVMPNLKKEVEEQLNKKDKEELSSSPIQVLSNPPSPSQSKKINDEDIIVIEDDAEDDKIIEEEDITALAEKDFKELKDIPYANVNMEECYDELISTPFSNIRCAFNHEELDTAVLMGDSQMVYSTVMSARFGLYLNGSDVTGMTLLHRVAESKCNERHEYDAIIEILVSKGADLSISDAQNSRTPLHTAIVYRNVCLAKMFIQLGSPINTLDSKRFSPLISAINTKNPTLVKLLLNAGANIEKGIDYIKVSPTVPDEIKHILLMHRMKIILCLDKARQVVFARGIPATHGTLPTTLYITPLNETEEINYKFTLAKDLKIYPNYYLLFECAVLNIDGLNEKISARMWHQSPIKKIYINGKEPIFVHKNANFISFPSLVEGINSVKIELMNHLYKGTKYCLTARVTHIFMPGFDRQIPISIGDIQDPQNQQRPRRQPLQPLQPSSSSSSSSIYQPPRRMRPIDPYYIPSSTREANKIRSSLTQPPSRNSPFISDYTSSSSTTKTPSIYKAAITEQHRQQQQHNYPTRSSKLPKGFVELKSLVPTIPSIQTQPPSTTTSSTQRGTNSRMPPVPLSAASNRIALRSSSTRILPTRSTIPSESHRPPTSTSSASSTSASQEKPTISRLQRQ